MPPFSSETFTNILLLIQIFMLCYNSLNYYRLFRAAPTAYGGSQARGRIGAVAAGLCHSHSDAGFELRLQLTPQLMTMPDP